MQRCKPFRLPDQEHAQNNEKSTPQENRAYHEVHWEATVERHGSFDFLDMLRGEYDVECLYVAVKVLNLATTQDREYIGSLLHHVCYRHWEVIVRMLSMLEHRRE